MDNGLLRKDEAQVVRTFREHLGIRCATWTPATSSWSTSRASPTRSAKRKVIGERFIRVFEREAQMAGGPFEVPRPGHALPGRDRERHPRRPRRAKIKTHHNVGGLPKDLAFKLIEPLRYLFKDEVARVGTELGPAGGDRLARPVPRPRPRRARLGEVTDERLDMLREADAIFVEEIKAAGLYRGLGQVFAVLTDPQHGGHGRLPHLRPRRGPAGVTTDDYMTADWARLPYEVLARISNRIVNEVQGVNRVVYDITSKPPATIEWE